MPLGLRGGRSVCRFRPHRDVRDCLRRLLRGFSRAGAGAAGDLDRVQGRDWRFVGAAAGSVVWFAVLGLAAVWLGRRQHALHIWRALDSVVALMMWGTALFVVKSLF
jgi:hypothetical protein